MGPVKFMLFYLLGGLAALALQIVVGPELGGPDARRLRGDRGVLGGYILLFPRARVVTVIFIIFFFTILELPALLVLGHLVPAAGAVRLLRPRAGRRRRRRRVLRPHRRVRLRAARRSALFASRAGSKRQHGALPQPLMAPRRHAAAGCWRSCWRSSRCWRSRRRARRTWRDPRDAPRPAATAPPGPLQDSATAPLAGGGTAPSPLAVRLDRPGDPVQHQLQEPAALGAAVRPRHRPGALPARPDARAADRLADEDDDRAGGRRPRPAGREGPDHQRGAALPGLRRRPAAARQVDRRQHDALRPAAAVGQRRGDRARPARRGRQREALRALHEREGRAMGLRLHALLDAERLRGRGQPLLRGRSRGDRPRRAARAAAGADRPPARGDRSRSRSRAGSSTSTTTTRCCGRATPARPGSRRATPTPRAAAWWRPRGAGRSSSASSCCTRPTPASRRCSCSTAASAPQRH